MIDWYKNNIGPSSIWYCDYYGIPVFLCVGSVDENTGELKLHELKTVKYVCKEKRGVALSFNPKDRCFRPKERFSCYISSRLKPNCYSKSNITAMPQYNSEGKIVLKIKIEYNSALYRDMIKMGNYQSWRIPNLVLEFHCIGDRKKYKEIINTYWPMKTIKIAKEEEESFEA